MQSESTSEMELQQGEDEPALTKNEIETFIKETENAIRLDDKLPESQKFKNSHLKKIQVAFPSFFDEESGNSNNPTQGLAQVIDYLQEERKSLDKLEQSLEECTISNHPEKKQTVGDYLDELRSTEMPSIFEDTE